MNLIASSNTDVEVETAVYGDTHVSAQHVPACAIPCLAAEELSDRLHATEAEAAALRIELAEVVARYDELLVAQDSCLCAGVSPIDDGGQHDDRPPP